MCCELKYLVCKMNHFACYMVHHCKLLLFNTKCNIFFTSCPCYYYILICICISVVIFIFPREKLVSRVPFSGVCIWIRSLVPQPSLSIFLWPSHICYNWTLYLNFGIFYLALIRGLYHFDSLSQNFPLLIL